MSDDLVILTSGPEVSFSKTNLQPPGQLYVTREDVGFLSTFNTATGVNIDVRGRVMLPSGRVVAFNHTQTPNTDRSSKTSTFPIPEGFLLNVFVVMSGGTAKRGQCYVVVGMGRGDGAARFDHAVLVQGYVGSNLNMAWPGNRLQHPTEGPGFMRVFQGTDPAAGVEISETVPTGARWRIVGARATFVTSAVAGNRLIRVFFNDGVNTLTLVPHPVQQAASLTKNFNYGVGMTLGASIHGNDDQQGLPNGLYMNAGWKFGTNTSGLDAGDNWGPPFLTVEEWIEP